jgi:LytS/YehU family sensor histidine kinase
MIILVLTITVNVIWLFVHADFPIEGRTAINLLLFWLPFVVLSLCIGLLVKFIRITMSYQLQQARVSAEHSRSELNLLQSQLSPHFLFNTLNNLYGISLTQPDKMPTLLLKLSELLRYSVYEVKELFVPLKDEIAYINNYIEFEKIRIGDRLELKTVIEDVTDHEATIAPMLLIVFIENGFNIRRIPLNKKSLLISRLKPGGTRYCFL